MKHFFLLPLFLFSTVFCFAKQEISFKNISVQTITYNEVSCLAIKFDAGLKYSYNQLLQQGDSTEQYVVEIRLKNTGFINVTKGYGTYQDAEGKVKNQYVLLLSNDVRAFESITVFIPLAAVDVAEGVQSVQPVFKVTDKRKHLITDNTTGDNFSVSFPQKMKLHISVKEIVADETDFKNEFWDYFFVDTNAAKPEVCWSVLLAGRKINGSPFTKNSYTYSDVEGKDDVEFTISKNDIFYINVYDFDMLSFSDEMGSMRMDMNEMKQYSGTNFSSKFGKVLKMDFVVTIL